MLFILMLFAGMLRLVIRALARIGLPNCDRAARPVLLAFVGEAPKDLAFVLGHG
jgi:hypothetical protein